MYHYNGESYNRQQIVKIHNELILGFYIGRQNSFEYSCRDEDFNNIREYLKIEINEDFNSVLINEQVDLYIDSDECWNGEFIYLDTNSNSVVIK